MAMDVERAGVRERRRRRNRVLLGAAVLAIVGCTLWLRTFEPASPTVDRNTVFIGEVRRGEMRRQVRGHGTLVPREMRWVPARTRGRIEEILLPPGSRVEPQSVILRLSNPEVEQAALDAKGALARAEAELAGLVVTLGSQQLDQQAQAAAVKAEWVEAQLRAEADRKLAQDGLLSSIQLQITEARADSLQTRHEIAKQRLDLASQANASRLEAKRAEVEQHRAMMQLREGQRAGLAVQAGMTGVIQEIPFEVGQEVAPGTSLARIARPDSLQAEVRIPATQARELAVGQAAQVDTRNGVVEGRVAHISPVVRQSAVEIEIELLGDLPPGARPDLTVEGRVQIEVLEDVLFVERPATGVAGSRVELFRLEPGGEHADKVPVRLGRASVRVIEVLEGLRLGDRIIVSDTSRWEEHARVRLE
jgi:HlyD family secretion protein